MAPSQNNWIFVVLRTYSPVLKERHGSEGFSIGTFLTGCIGLYWVGYVGFKVPNGRHGSLFKHQSVHGSELDFVKILF